MTNPNALKTIGEVSRLIEVPIYVLRFWEKKFKLVVPIKKKTGIRYYDEKQILILERVKELLYVNKYSIEGANKILHKDFQYASKKKKIVGELKFLINEIKKII